VGDGHGLSADEIRKKYKGYKELGELLRDLVKASPPWQVRAQGHGVRIYCPCGDPEHTLSVPSTPRDDANAAKRVHRFAERCHS